MQRHKTYTLKLSKTYWKQIMYIVWEIRSRGQMRTSFPLPNEQVVCISCLSNYQVFFCQANICLLVRDKLHIAKLRKISQSKANLSIKKFQA